MKKENTEPKMLLSELLAKIDAVVVKNFCESYVTSVEESSKRVKRGTIFVARRGANFDGNRFVHEAVMRGVCAVVTENSELENSFVTTIISKNASKTMAEILKVLYGDAVSEMTIIGITGTKGKTSTLKILSECIRRAGRSLVSIGTLGAQIYATENESYSTDNTTPSSPFIYEMLHRAHSLGARIAVIEVSSQALREHRVYGIPFTVCIFTNIFPDHIGIHEHKSFEDYLLAKRSLFKDYRPKIAIVNADDKNWYRITEGCSRIVKVGMKCENEYSLINSNLFFTEFLLSGKRFKLSVGGSFNGINAALALTAAYLVLGVDVYEFRDCLNNITIPGRYEVYSLGKIQIVIDFAHNGQSLASLLKSVRPNTNGRLILVFGSVGERCLTRRAELAKAAEIFADFSVITSDNPGREPPECIVNEIYSHFNNKDRAITITDREKAILYAISQAKDGDIVLLVGKGQEEYQLTDKGKVYFSERKIIEDLGALKQ